MHALINGDLVKGNDGNWHTTNESFSKIVYQNPNPNGDRTTDYWEAWDKGGNHYVFNLNALTEDKIYDRGGTACDGDHSDTTYRWMLHSITDTHGNVITYTYKYEPTDNTQLVETPPTTTVRAVYPSKIEYGTYQNGNATMLVLFSVVDRHIDGDIDTSSDDLNTPFYQSYRVDGIKVQRLQSGGGYTTLRQYDLVQDYSTVLIKHNAGGVQYDTSYIHLTLARVIPRGTDPALQLPNMTLRYVQAGDPVTTLGVTSTDTGPGPENCDDLDWRSSWNRLNNALTYAGYHDTVESNVLAWWQYP